MVFRIEIAAGLGIGKTTLCQALAKNGYAPAFEDLRNNPYLADFYADPARFAFPAQLAFVPLKYNQIATLPEGRANILDYSIVNGRVYSKLVFGEGAKPNDIIEQGFDYLESKLGAADLILHLNCPVDVQMFRLRRRNRTIESNVKREYLEAFNEHLHVALDAERQKGRKVLTIEDNNVTGLSWDNHISSVAATLSAALYVARPAALNAPKP